MPPPAAALLLVLTLLVAGCAAPGGPEGAGDGATWELRDTQGATWTGATLEGNASLLFFMATWCGTCRGKAPTLATLHEEYGDRVQFLSVGWDPTESDAELEAWKAERAQPWPHGVDAAQSVTRAYGVRVQSWMVVLDGQGEVLLNKYNADEAALRSALEAALASAKS